MATASAEVDMTSDDNMDVSQESSVCNTTAEDSFVSVGSDKSDDNKNNESKDDLNVSIDSTASSGSQPKKKKKKLSLEEKKKILEERNRLKAEREAEKERKSEELKAKKELLEKQRLEKIEQKKAEKEKKEKERLEKEAQRLREKEEKQKEKEEKQKEKEEKQKEKEEKLKEKEEKQKERDLEKLKKQEEIMEKKRKLDEEKARKEEEKQKEIDRMNRQKNILNKFFIKKTSDDKPATRSQTTNNSRFRPFQLKANQTIASIVPEVAKKRFNRQVLDELIVAQTSHQLYLDILKNSNYNAIRYHRPKEDEPEIIIEDQSDEDEGNQMKKYRVKHLQFDKNVRPPYRGTFSKKSSKIKPRKPFIKDNDLLNYEVDSDDEWEEEEPGESCDGSDSDGSVKDDYEIDNDIFVPHGYLSEDENDDQNEDQVVKPDVTDTEMADNGEEKGAKSLPLLKEQVLMAERNRSFSSTLTPVVIGCYWESNPNPNINKKALEALQAFKRIAISSK